MCIKIDVAQALISLSLDFRVLPEDCATPADGRIPYVAAVRFVLVTRHSVVLLGPDQLKIRTGVNLDY